MKIRVPFKHMRVLLVERDIEFIFTLASLEIATKEVLKCDLHQIGEHPAYDLNVAILYGAYIQACRVNYKKPKFGFEHATFWYEHMSKAAQMEFLQACTELMGEMKKGEGEKKK